MAKKSLKLLQSDKIFVKGKFPTKKSASLEEDVGLLALQLVCTKRSEITPQDVANDQTIMDRFYCMTIETKQISSLVFFATMDELDLGITMYNLSEQVRNIIKSSNEKILYIDYLEIHREKFPFLELMVNFADVSFVWDSPKTEILVNYFKLQQASEKDRYDAIKLDDLGDQTPAQADMFLYFPRNNRYIHYVKKGKPLEDHRRQRLEKRGINRLFSPKGQAKSEQTKRVATFLDQLYKKYADVKKAV